MARSTKAQQVSTGTPDSYTPEELADPVPPIRITRAMLGVVPEEVKPSVGTDSSPSSESETTKSGNENPNPLAPAQMTENHSGQQGKETDSTAALTGGVGQTETEPPLSDEDDEDEFEDDDEEPEEEQAPAPVVKKATPPKKATKKAQARVRSINEFE